MDGERVKKHMTREQRRLRRAENLLFLMIILAFVLVFGMTAKACADITGTPPAVQMYAALHTSDIATPEEIEAAYEEAVSIYEP